MYINSTLRAFNLLVSTHYIMTDKFYSLENNSVGDKGAVAVSNAATTMTSLEKL